MNPALSGVAAYVAVQGLGPAAEFEHLPQNRDPPPRRRVSQHVQHGANRVRVGVVAIVDHQDATVTGTLAPHFFGTKFPDPFRKTFRRNSMNTGGSDPGQDVRYA